MRLPALKEIPTSRDFIDNFGGYNHNVRIGENEFYDMKNLTSSHYPVLATRNKRGTYLPTSSFAEGLFQQREFPVGFINKDGLCVVTVSEIGTNYQLKIRIGEKVYAFPQLTNYDSSHKRNVVSMGAYIVIFPDNVYINTATINDDEPEMGCFESSLTNTSTITFFPRTKDGKNIYISQVFDKTTDPDFLTEYAKKDSVRGPVNYQYVLEETTGDLFYWVPSDDGGAWFSDRAYLGMIFAGVSSKFEVGDGIRFDGFDKEKDADKEILKDLFNDDINRPFAVTAIKNNNITLDYKLANFKKCVNSKNNNTNTAVNLRKITPIMD